MSRSKIQKSLPEEIGGNPNTVTYSFGNWMQVLEKAFGHRWQEYRSNFAASNKKSTALGIANKITFPITLTLELVNRCNLKCVMCWTDNHSMSLGTLSVSDIDNLLREASDAGSPISAVIIGLGAEPILHRDVKEIVSVCLNRGVMDIFFGTNGVLLDEEMALFLIDSGVSRLEVSLDAATRETYKRIRGKDKYEQVERNIRNFISLRNSLNKDLPIVRLAFVVQDLNLHERALFLEKWSDVVDYVDFQQLQDFSSVSERLGKSLDYWVFSDEDSQTKALETQKLQDKLLRSGAASPDVPFCPYPFNSLNVWGNGDISPCCCFHGRSLVIGNIKDMSLEQAWKSESVDALRREMTDGKLNRVCRTCLDRDELHRIDV